MKNTLTKTLQIAEIVLVLILFIGCMTVESPSLWVPIIWIGTSGTLLYLLTRLERKLGIKSKLFDEYNE